MKQVRTQFTKNQRVDTDALACGIHVVDCGLSDVPHGQSPDSENTNFQSWKSGQVQSEFLIIYLTKGSGVYEPRKGQCKPVEAGDVLLLSPGEWHRYYHDKGTDWEECWVGFSGEYARHLMSHFFQSSERILKIGFDLGLHQSIRSLPELLGDSQPGRQLQAATRTIDIIARLRVLHLRKACQPGLEDRIQEICMELNTDLGESVDFKSLASMAGVSYTKFRTSFKEITGLPPQQYLIEKRIHRAEDLLLHTENNVSEIANLLGFDTLYYFSRLFKMKTGLSPTDYRKQVT